MNIEPFTNSYQLANVLPNVCAILTVQSSLIREIAIFLLLYIIPSSSFPPSLSPPPSISHTLSLEEWMAGDLSQEIFCRVCSNSDREGGMDGPHQQVYRGSPGQE